MKGVWAKNKSFEKNYSIAFLLQLKNKEKADIEVSASSFYKLFADGKMIGFGPQRAAHGFFRTQNYHINCKNIVVEVNNIGVETFCWLKQQPFFTCEIETSNGEKFCQDDFCCYHIDDRLQKVQRYSFQRGFAENYIMFHDRTSLYNGIANYEKLETEEVELPKKLKSYVDNAKLEIHKVKSIVERGSVKIDDSLPLWRDRAHYNVGKGLEGYKIDEWENSATDEVSRFVYQKDEYTGDLQYFTLDFGRDITGFQNLKVHCKNKGVVYFIFDELLFEESGRGNYVAFERNTCSSVHKWKFDNANTFTVSTDEPYTVRYATLIYSKDIEIEDVTITDFENPNANRFCFDCDDKELNIIIEAARNTLAQNSVDVLTDCPSRERSGWLSDSWFSSIAERLFSGENQAEKTFLENYIYAKGNKLPKGVLPMNYPSDAYNGTFIPNWNFWYISEIYKYYGIYGKDDLVNNSLNNIKGILEYFQGKENEFSLLENLDGWVFIEWSSANWESHTKGVNIPSNITYAYALECASELLNDVSLKNKADKIREYIKNNAFCGLFLVDNLIRNDKNILVKTNNFTEVCQYYAFWFNFLDISEYNDMFNELIDNLGPNRKKGYREEIGEANVLYGLYMRIDLLMRIHDRKQVLSECKTLFLKMAKRTGTLWENNDISASCNHGFASYACKWIIYALTGYDIVQDKFLDKGDVGIKYNIKIPKQKGKEILELKN